MKLPQAGGTLDVRALDCPVCCIVHLATQPPNVFQQVTIRPDKVSKLGFIRLGETPGDEALCWIKAEHIEVVEVLGTAVIEETKVTVTPIPQEVPDLLAAA